MIKKKDIVWFYTEESGWKRGRVQSINMYYGPYMKPIGMWVKPYRNKLRVFIPYRHTVVDAALTKPTHPPIAPMPYYSCDYEERVERSKLYKKLGINNAFT